MNICLSLRKRSDMVDLARRKVLAYHLRHLTIGLISNDEFEEEMFPLVIFLNIIILQNKPNLMILS